MRRACKDVFGDMDFVRQNPIFVIDADDHHYLRRFGRGKPLPYADGGAGYLSAIDGRCFVKKILTGMRRSGDLLLRHPAVIMNPTQEDGTRANTP